MYAIFETGGKQYCVEEGDVLDVELLGTESTESKKAKEPSVSSVTFDSVLFVHDGKSPKIGLPYVPQCAVHAEVKGESKGPKVIAYKCKPCKNSRRTVGHRQRYSRIKITKIIAVG